MGSYENQLVRAGRFLQIFTLLFLSTQLHAWAAGSVATSTTLSLSSSGNSIASGGTVAVGNAVTLTASVTAGSAKVTIGQVNFCDASATYCTDIHVIGTAQLTSAGTAMVKFFPRIGSHQFKAVFVGTPNGATQYGASSSDVESLTVSGSYPTSTEIAVSGDAGNYTLTATVTGTGGIVGPTGTVSFVDTTANNATAGTAALGSPTASLSFLSSLSPPTDNSEFVVTGDFNGDGLVDVAASNRLNGTVSVFLSNGDGTFTQATNSPMTVVQSGQYVNAIVAGDFNADGKLDLAVQVSGTVIILTGAGDGTFSIGAPISLPSGYYAGYFAVADLNQDGYLDLAVTTGSNNSVVALLGNGDGTFHPASGTPAVVGRTPSSIAVGDFNGDGIPDLATTAFYDFDVSILLGNGDGTFTQASNSPIPVGIVPSSIAVADFNGDGRADFAVANGTNTLSLFLGNGDGTFTPGNTVTIGYAPQSVAFGDFNGDGVPDLVTANEDDGDASVLLGKGDGTFTVYPTYLSVGNNPNSVASGVFTTDGRTGFVEADGSHFLQVYRPQITQTATAAASSIAPFGTGTHQVDAAYAGDSLYAGSTSATASLTATGFSASGQALTVTAGATTGNTSTITITPSGGFTGSVTLTAAITSSPANALNPPTVSFGTTSPVTISGTGTASATLTIATTAPIACSAVIEPARQLPWRAAGGAILACLLLIWLPSKRARGLLGMFILLAFAAGGVAACGSGNGQVANCNSGRAGTTSGAYTITVTATSGTNKTTGTISLTVQ